MTEMYEELVKRLREHGEFLIVSDRMKAPHNVNVRNVFAEDYYQAADAIEEMQAGEKKFLRNISALEMENENLKRARRWIPIMERLPENNGYYLTYVESALFPNSYYFNLIKFIDGDFIEDHCVIHRVTHWQPLPELPKEET